MDGERELLAELSGWLAIDLRRNLDQCRDGGADCIELGRYVIEIKRAERFRAEWLVQAERQAAELGANRIPVLAWRPSRQPWRCLVVQSVAQFADALRDAEPANLAKKSGQNRPFPETATQGEP